MRIISFLLVGLLGIFMISACDDDDDASPADDVTADFTADVTNPDINESVEFNPEHEDEEASYKWEFEGGTPETSEKMKPNVEWEEEGDFDVKLTLEPSDEEEVQEAKENFIEVRSAVERTNTPLVKKYTATWCYFCGVYGFPEFQSIIDNHQDEVAYLSLYASNNEQHITGTDASAFMEEVRMGTRATPRFFVNREQMDWEPEQTRHEVADYVEDFKQKPVVVNSSVDYEIQDGEIVADVTTRFFEDMEADDYLLGIFVVEHNVEAPQEGLQEAMSEHKYVLIQSLADDVFLEFKSDEEIEAMETFENTFSKEIRPNWNEENLSVMAIKLKGDFALRILNTSWAR